MLRGSPWPLRPCRLPSPCGCEVSAELGVLIVGLFLRLCRPRTAKENVSGNVAMRLESKERAGRERRARGGRTGSWARERARHQPAGPPLRADGACCCLGRRAAWLRSERGRRKPGGTSDALAPPARAREAASSKEHAPQPLGSCAASQGESSSQREHAAARGWLFFTWLLPCAWFVVRAT